MVLGFWGRRSWAGSCLKSRELRKRLILARWGKIGMSFRLPHSVDECFRVCTEFSAAWVFELVLDLGWIPHWRWAIKSSCSEAVFSLRKCVRRRISQSWVQLSFTDRVVRSQVVPRPWQLFRFLEILYEGIIVSSETVMSSNFRSKARFKIVNSGTRLVLWAFLQNLVYINTFHSWAGYSKSVSLSLGKVTAFAIQVTRSINLVSGVASSRTKPRQVWEKSFALSTTPLLVKLTHRIVTKRICVASWHWKSTWLAERKLSFWRTIVDCSL